MGSRQIDKVREWIGARGLAFVGESDFLEIAVELGIAESPLRKLLRETETPPAPLAEGVRQDSFDNLGRTLIALQDES